MKAAKGQNSRLRKEIARRADRARRRHGGWTLASITAAIILLGAAQPRQQPQSPPGDLNPVSQDNSTHNAGAPLSPTVEDSAQLRNDTARPARVSDLAEDSANLLKMATDLKAEVDKTNKNTLSLRVIRTADEIERLAHNVREKMKSSVAAK